jgi:indole-3-glycerol phosphate synthase
MQPRLRDILSLKRRELSCRSHGFDRDYPKNPPKPRDFKNAVCRPGRVGIIAEFKRGSPSAGPIRETADPVQFALSYERAGAAAVSVVTERNFFNGDLQTLSLVCRAVSIPVLRKDFIIDESQIHESRMLGADAVLLIARILSKRRLSRFIDLCRHLGMAVLTEVHSVEDLKKALACNADIVGINNRDLETFDVSLETTSRLAPLIPPDCCIVSESGFNSPGDIYRLKTCGISAALVGTAFMSADYPGEAVGELVRAGVSVNEGGI